MAQRLNPTPNYNRLYDFCKAKGGELKFDWLSVGEYASDQRVVLVAEWDITDGKSGALVRKRQTERASTAEHAALKLCKRLGLESK